MFLLLIISVKIAEYWGPVISLEPRYRMLDSSFLSTPPVHYLG